MQLFSDISLGSLIKNQMLLDTNRRHDPKGQQVFSIQGQMKNRCQPL